MRILLVFVCLLLPAEIYCGYFSNSPSVSSIHENNNGVVNVWSSIVAQCQYSYDTWDWCWRSIICWDTITVTDQCTSCYISNDPSNHFQMSGSTLQKKSCSDSCCGPTCSSAGCFNSGSTYSVTVTCSRTGYDSPSQTVHVSASDSADPWFSYSEGSTIHVYKSQGVGTVINTIQASLEDNSDDDDCVTYEQRSGPQNSYLLATAGLFYLDTSNGKVKIGKSLTMEFSYQHYVMNLCVRDRRHQYYCLNLNIILHACFQTPTCNDQSHLSLHDTYGTYTGHGGSSDVFLTMTYPAPSEHFPYFSTTWHDLTWTFDSNEFPEAALDSNSGEIYVTRNISIWPSWPTKDYYQTVRVSNSESCYTTTCQMHIRVHYTNWPIGITSLPTSYWLHEDYDDEILIHRLYVYDYNYVSEDNVTCELTSVSPPASNMFELRHDGGHNRDSYILYKLACQTPDCGYKPSNYLCDLNIGCLNHNLTQQYIVTIKCDDAYNTTDSKDFTFNVIKNAAPVYSNLANTIALERRRVSHFDTIYSVLYSDYENERLYYEYTYEDQETGVDPDYFLGSESGNFTNDRANITMTVHLADKPVNKTYLIYVCGHERRNEICDYLTVHVEEYCGESPDCVDASVSVTTEFAIGGELFDMSTLVTGPTQGTPYKGLSYAMTADSVGKFRIDHSTGRVTSTDILTTNFPTSTQKIYTLMGFVYDQGACSYGTCSLVITVSAVNYPINIDNLPDTVTIPEDTYDSMILFTPIVSDNNEDDTYTCSITNTNSVEPFFLDRDFPTYGSYHLKNRENPSLTTATVTYMISINCEDSQGSSDTDTLTVIVIPNEAPTLTNLNNPTSISVDPMDYAIWDTIYTVTASDAENDDLTFTCSVDTNYVPLECFQESEWHYAEIRLRRSLEIFEDNGQVVGIDVCVSDAKHLNAECGSLEVTITRTLTPPEISNLPRSVNVAENAEINQWIFTPDIVDPDVGETHIITISVNPVSHTNKFRFISSNGTLRVGSALDYEDVNYYEVTYSVRDDYLDALEDKVLVINILNVNEENTITADQNIISFYENAALNTTFADYGIRCTDIDGDDVTISITGGLNSEHFGYNQDTNRLYLAQVWDYEVSSGTGEIILTCSDGALTSTFVFAVSVIDVNDNKPVIVIISGDTNTITINIHSTLLDVFLTIGAADSDSSSGGDFDFRVAGNGIASQIFQLVPRTSRKRSSGATSADLMLKTLPSFTHDKSFTLVLLVCDNFGDSDEECGSMAFTVNFTVILAEKTKETKCLLCTSTGRTIVGLLGLEGAVIIILIMHCVCTAYYRRNEVSELPASGKPGIWHIPASVTFNQPKIPPSRRSVLNTQNKPGKPGAVKLRPVKKEVKIEEVSSSSESSSSSDDEEPIKNIPQRKDIGRDKFHLENMGKKIVGASGLPAPIHASSVGLPPPVYSSR